MNETIMTESESNLEWAHNMRRNVNVEEEFLGELPPASILKG